MFKKLKKLDPIILITTLLLLSIGLFTLFSLTISEIPYRSEILKSEFSAQIIYALLGIFVMFLCFYMPFYYFKLNIIQILLSIFTIFLLIYTIFFAQDINNVRRWITIGSQVMNDGSIIGGITIQPSEFAKITIILITASLLSVPIVIQNKKVRLINKIKDFLVARKSIIFAILFNILILGLILEQKSLSVPFVIGIIVLLIFFASIDNKINAILLFTTYFLSILCIQNIFPIEYWIRFIIFMIPIIIYIYSVYSEKINSLTIFTLIAFGIISGSIILNFTWNNILRPYQRERIENYLSSDIDSQDEGYQQNQSLISIGAGGIFGQGFRQISDSRIMLLPEPTTDFIFAIFSFKFGLIGVIIVLGLFFTLLLRIFYLADKMNDRFSSLILIGVGSMIFVQLFFNIGMNAGILPVGGTTLPFMSAGGSSLLSSLIGIGICLNVIATNNLEKTIHQRYDKIKIDGWNN